MQWKGHCFGWRNPRLDLLQKVVRDGSAGDDGNPSAVRLLQLPSNGNYLGDNGFQCEGRVFDLLSLKAQMTTRIGPFNHHSVALSKSFERFL